MELELTQDRIDLIEKLIRSDKKYTSNEDLYEDFFNETYKRSFLILKTVKNEASLEAYLKKIVTTSIVVVLKDLGRVRRTKEGFVPTQEKTIEEIVEIPDNKYSDIKVSYDVVDLKDNPPEEMVIKKEILQTVADAVHIAQNSNPSKQYMQLYELRYVKGLKQKQIAKELNLSQSEVSKRLLELVSLVKEAFGKKQ